MPPHGAAIIPGLHETNVFGGIFHAADSVCRLDRLIDNGPRIRVAAQPRHPLAGDQKRVVHT